MQNKHFVNLKCSFSVLRVLDLFYITKKLLQMSVFMHDYAQCSSFSVLL